MNPTQPPKPTATIPIKPSVTSAADKILATAKRVTEMPPHQVSAQSQQEKKQDSAKAPAVLGLDAPVFDVAAFIHSFEQDALDQKFGHLGVGDYDKLLIQKVQQNMDFVPERDTKVHLLITQSVSRYAVKITNRPNV